MTTKVAINGFGRIGRSVFKIILERYSPQIEVVAINDLSDAEVLVHLLKNDSVYGHYGEKIECEEKTLRVTDNEKNFQISLLSEKDPENLPWREMGVDIVLECTGLFTDYQGSKKHITAGAKKVIISAPSRDPEDIPSYLLGVNEKDYDLKSDDIVDMGSCTTNCLAPLLRVLHREKGVLSGMMTTIHSYTANQNLLDGPHKDLRRSRAAALNMIPTTTGAAKAIGRVIPELSGKIRGMAVRVPTPTVSAVDLTCLLEEGTTKEEVNNLLKKASLEEDLKGILKVEESSLVSADYIGDSFSSIVDAQLTDVEGDLVKIFAWYDNEWGYAARLADFTKYIGEQL